MEKENWINSIINSTDGITKVIPDEQLFSKIQSRIINKEVIGTRWLWLAAASFALLFLLNAKAIADKNRNVVSPIESIAANLSNSNQLY